MTVAIAFPPKQRRKSGVPSPGSPKIGASVPVLNDAVLNLAELLHEEGIEF